MNFSQSAVTDASVSMDCSLNPICYVIMYLTLICAVSSVRLDIIMGHYLNYGSVSSQGLLIQGGATHPCTWCKQQTPHSAAVCIFWRVSNRLRQKCLSQSHLERLIAPI